MLVAPEISFASRSIEDLAMPHQARVNPLTGSLDIDVPIPLTTGRAGFSPSLSLQYSSSAGNSVYGMGWNLAGLSAIAINTKNGLPKYNSQDKYAFNGTDELVPSLIEQDNVWEPRIDDRDEHWVHYFRSKIERSQIRFEQWVNKESGRIHWRARGADNSVSVFGRQKNNYSRICDPSDSNRTYLWLIEAQYDSQGNAIFYDYLPENGENIEVGQTSYEWNRIYSSEGFAQRYLKRIRYGNTEPLGIDRTIADDNRWLFEVVFDYGDHQNELFYSPLNNPPWPARLDAYSTYRPGFELRTYRLCRRILMFHNFSELNSEPVLIGATNLTHRQDRVGTILTQILHQEKLI